MSWRSSAERELRTRVSPELVAAILVAVVALALIGIFGLTQSRGTGPAPGGSTSEPAASASPAPSAAFEHDGHVASRLELAMSAAG